MRITESENYRHAFGCSLSFCERMYCSEHRLLWRDCETAIHSETWAELRDCPECMAEDRMKRFVRNYKLAV